MKIKYPIPNKSVGKISKNKTHGMLFENSLNISNEYYRIHKKAYIYKKPTPIQVVKVDYPARSSAKIVEAYYRTPSTTDYNGIYRGKYIDYEAKETNNLSLSFKHIFPHQVDHLKNISLCGGIGFVIIYFKRVNEIYLVDINVFYNLYYSKDEKAMKSFSIEQAREFGILIKQGYTPPIDYLKAIDEYYFTNNN